MADYDEIVQQYRMVFDHHTHTVYSHGKGTIEDNVRVAVDKGLKSVAITDHGPGHLTYGLDMQKIDEIREEITELKHKFPQIEILLGVEANTTRVAPYLDVKENQKEKFDIILAGYHYGILRAGMIPNYINVHVGVPKSEGSILLVKNTAMILDALYNNHIDILTHPGDKGPFNIDHIARACADTGTLMEINGKHKHMDVEEIRIAAQYPVRFVIGSDAHVPEKVGEFKEPLRRALEAGLAPSRIVNIERI